MLQLPKISGVDRIEGNCISLLQSQKNVASFLFVEDGEYRLELICKRKTNNILFLHNLISQSQNIHLNIRIEEGSQLFCIGLFHVNPQTELYVAINNTCENNGKFHFVGLHTNQGRSHIQVISTAQGANIESNLSCIGIGKQNSYQMVSLKNISAGVNNIGEIINRSVLFDTATAKQDGEPIIEKTGQGSNYTLEQKALLVGKKARVISRPLLSVANNQVKASHNASVSTFPAEDIFYLESRGLDKEGAMQMAVEGFVSEILQSIPSKNMQECLSENMKKFVGF